MSIIPVSLGADIALDGYKGKLAPINIHLPIFMGLLFALKDEVTKKEGKIDELSGTILNDTLNKSNEISKWFFKDFGYIRQLESNIIKNSYERNNLKDNYDIYKKYTDKLLDELNSKVNLVYFNNLQRRFSDIFRKEYE
ncbi:MAG: hypothetical protein LBD23_11250 [Oscillospiraceae bacterium]|nr:hypothetical protein [Oscillospiraceae bacterium]